MCELDSSPGPELHMPVQVPLQLPGPEVQHTLKQLEKPELVYEKLKLTLNHKKLVQKNASHAKSVAASEIDNGNLFWFLGNCSVDALVEQDVGEIRNIGNIGGLGCHVSNPWR